MKLIQQNELVTFECPSCGYIIKGKSGSEIDCPKCDPDFNGWKTINKDIILPDGTN